MSPSADPDAIAEKTQPTGAVPHFERPLCEPVDLAPGARIRIERVREGPDAGASGAFPHFHDVHEIVLFGAVAGWMFARGMRWPLRPGCAVSVPSSQVHDFVLEPGSRDWTLLQVDAGTAAALLGRPGLSPLAAARCVVPGDAQRARLEALLEWLWPLPADDPQAVALVELVLHQLACAPTVAGESVSVRSDALERLRPSIERLRRDPAHPPSAEAAAALCALSPAYFSRRFKRQIGLSWSDYVRTHRLHLASQRLLEGDCSAATIAGDLGFSSPSHFGEMFLRHFGMTPAAYRHRARETGAAR